MKILSLTLSELDLLLTLSGATQRWQQSVKACIPFDLILIGL